MTQAEYKRPRNAGWRKMAVITLLVLVLCLACFALGIMVGGSGSEVVAENAAGRASVSASVREMPESRAVVSDSEQTDSEQAFRKAKYAAEQEQTADISASPDTQDDGEKKVQTEEAVVQEAPLGSGINPRKKAGATDVAVTQEPEQGAASAPRVTPQSPVSQGSQKASAAEQEQGSSAPQVTAANEGKYVVQVASFRAEADAGALAQKLKPEFPAYVREVDLNEKGIWFRVLVGPWTQREEADEAQRRIKESAKLDGFVKKAR